MPGIFIEYCEFLIKFSFSSAKKENNARDICPIHCQKFQPLLTVSEREGRGLDQELGNLGPGAAHLPKGPGKPLLPAWIPPLGDHRLRLHWYQVPQLRLN